MSAEVRIGTLHWRRGRDRRAAEDAVRGLDLAAGIDDHRVLVVRRLRARSDDPAEARSRLNELRRTAARPAAGPVDPRADAVEFADEAEALLCLTRDIAVEVARRRWWWAHRLPQQGGATGDLLAAAWADGARWVPSVLATLAAEDPSAAVRLVSLMPASAQEATLAAVLAEYAVSVPPSSVLAHAMRAPASRALSVASAQAPQAAELPDEGSVARTLVTVALLLCAEPARADRVLAGWLGPDDDGHQASERPSGILRNGSLSAVADSHDEPGDEAGDEPGSADAPPDGTVTPLRPSRGPRLSDPSGGTPGSWSQSPWSGSGPLVRSQMATLLYAVNLVRWFGLHRFARQATGWAAVDAVGRWLWRDLPARRRAELLQDPLLALLAELDGRDPDAAPTLRLGAALRPVRRFLTENEVPADAFFRSGTVVVSRTHVDVVLSVDQVDLAARASGLDQDPGWVPELGRVVLFHFEDAR